MSEQVLEEGPEVSPAPEVILPRQLPGGCLRQARESLGVGVDEVAQVLKFSSRQIEALERDDYQLLQGSTFVRGFIRAYAKLLKLDADMLLLQLDAEVPPTQAEIMAPCNMGEAAPEHFVERNQRLLISVLLLLVAAVVAGYLYTRQGAGMFEDLVVVRPSVDAQQAEVTATVAVPPVIEPQTVPAAAPVEPMAQSTTTPAVAPSVTALPVAPVSVPVATAPTLVFDFDGVSWLEVKDATQRILLTGEFPKGSHQMVSGRPPYQLWVGRASSVRVVYRDRAVDLQPYTRDAVARLTLD